MNKYECELCDSAFKLNVELRIHIRNEHSQITPQQKTTKYNNSRGPEKPKVDHPSSNASNNPTSTKTKVIPGPNSQEKKFKLSLNSVTPVFGDGLSSTNDNVSSRDDSSSVTSSSVRKTPSIKSQSSSSSRSSINNNNNGRSWNYQRRFNQVQDDDDECSSDEDAENSDNEQEDEDEEKSNTTTKKATTMGSNENDKKQNRKSAPQKRTSTTTDNDNAHSERSSDDNNNGMNIESGEQINVQNIYIQQRTMCTYCNRVLSNIKSLILHHRRYHNENKNETTTTFISPTYFPSERPRMFSCIKCTKKYESNNLLWKHRINSCGLASKYKCKFCYKQHKLLCRAQDCAKSHTRAQLTKFKEELEIERQRKQQQKQMDIQKVEADSSSNISHLSSKNQQPKSSSSSLGQHECFYKTCNKVFKDRSQLSEHGLLEHKIFMCIYCDSILLSQDKLDKHYGERHSTESIVVNDKCNIGAFNDSHKQNTEENQNSSEYGDDIVHTKIKSSTHSDETASILTHSTTEIKQEIDIEETKKPILVIGREEEEAMQVGENPSVNEENFNCKICGINCMSTFALEIHSRKHQTFFKCVVCNEKFVSSEFLENHIKQQHHSFKSQKEPSKTMNCVQCGQIFTKLKDYIRHKKQHQNSGTSPSASTEETDTDGKTDADDTDSSSMDNFTTANEESKRSSRIRRQRSPEINIKCELCQTEFHRKSHYDYHLTRELCKEKAENEYKCNKCDQSFRRLTTLENHKKSHSEPEDTVLQEAEEDSFIIYNQYRPNKEQHQSEKSDASRFKKPIQLNPRKRRQESPLVTSSDDESLPLQNKKIARIQPQSPKIQRNNKQDGGYFAQQTTDHKCVECLSLFSTSQELALHLLEHNRIKMRQAEIAQYEKETEEQPSQLQLPTKFLRASRKTGISLHKCPICGLQRFKAREQMIDHVKARHQKVGEYGCPYSDSCKKLCKSALEVCEHVLRHEKQAEIDGNGDVEVEENTRSRSIIKSNNNVQPRIQAEPSHRPGPQKTRNKINTKPIIQSSTKKTSTSSNSSNNSSHAIPCPVCKKNMESRIQLKSHILSNHLDRSFKFCPKPSCSVLFHDQSGLKRHISEGNCVI